MIVPGTIVPNRSLGIPVETECQEKVVMLPASRREWALLAGGALVAAAAIFVATPRYEIIRGNALTFLRVDRWTGAVERCAATCRPAKPDTAPKGRSAETTDGWEVVSRPVSKSGPVATSSADPLEKEVLAGKIVEVKTLPGITLRLGIPLDYCEVSPSGTSQERADFDDAASALRKTKNQLLARFVECSYLESLRTGVLASSGTAKWLHIAVVLGNNSEPTYFPGVSRQKAIAELANSAANDQKANTASLSRDEYGVYWHRAKMASPDLNVSGSVGMTLVKSFVITVSEYRVNQQSGTNAFDVFDVVSLVRSLVTMSDPLPDTLISARGGQDSSNSLWDGVVDKGVIGAIVGALIATIFGAGHFLRRLIKH